MNVPEEVRRELKGRLWKEAEELGWTRLPAGAKARRYEVWTRDPEVGDILGRYMDKGKIRVYIKDTLLKDFSKASISDSAQAYRVLGIAAGAEVVERYIKPHGLRFADGRVVSWGRAEDWKTILMAMHERTFGLERSKPFGVVLRFAAPRYETQGAREVVEDAAMRFSIHRVVWLDN